MLVTVWSALEGASQVVLAIKNLPTDAGDARDAALVPGLERSLEKGMASHSSVLAWKIPWTEGPGRLPSMGLQRAEHD